MPSTREILSALDGLGVVDALGIVERAVDRVAYGDIAALSDTEVEGLLDRLRRPLTQLDGVRAKLALESRRRRVRARPDLPTVQVADDHRKELGRQQRLGPGEVDRLIEAGRAAEVGTATDAAVRAGTIGVSQARTIGRVLTGLFGEQRAEVEAELLQLAASLDPVAFGRAARAVQGRVQPEMLAKQERHQEFQRRFRATDTEDGGFAFSGLLHGTAAETARVALAAFRRADSPDEHRTPEQRGADAFEQLCASALAAGSAPARHGERPQVMVLVDADALAELDEAPERVAGRFAWSGQPVSGRTLRHLVADCKLLRVVLDADQVPIEVSTTVRTVPAGLWRALLVRDGGCVWPGCDAPASWCDVAHARVAFADDGRLTMDNAMLLCRRHHRRYDNGPQTVTIHGGAVRFPHLEMPDATRGGPTGGGHPTRGSDPTDGSDPTGGGHPTGGGDPTANLRAGPPGGGQTTSADGRTDRGGRPRAGTGPPGSDRVRPRARPQPRAPDARQPPGRGPSSTPAAQGSLLDDG